MICEKLAHFGFLYEICNVLGKLTLTMALSKLVLLIDAILKLLFLLFLFERLLLLLFRVGFTLFAHVFKLVVKLFLLFAEEFSLLFLLF